MATRNAPAFGFQQAFMALKTVWERRRVMGQLGALDDYMLRDIGITRFDISSVAAEPLFRDPTKKLAERADETRRAHRASAREMLGTDFGTGPHRLEPAYTTWTGSPRPSTPGSKDAVTTA